MTIINGKVQYALPTQDFDWGISQAKSKVKSKTGKIVEILSTAPYAQEMYSNLEEHFESKELKSPSQDTTVIGKVIKKTDTYAEIDIDWRESAYIDLSKENSEYIKYIEEGSEIEVYLKSINLKNKKSKTFSIIASYTELVKKKKFEDIKNSVNKNVAYMAKVKSLVYGGYFLDIDGIEVFMPGSQGGMNKLIDFESLVGSNIYVCPINFDNAKQYIVVSHRAYLKTQVPIHADELEKGQDKSGIVTGTSKFGVFVEFDGCLTGLIHKSDLNEAFITKYESEKIKPGDSIDFKIKEIVDPFRIVCTQNEIIDEIDPWDNITSKYKTPSKITGKIKKVTRFGTFIELEPKISGLLHKTEYDDINIEMIPGNDITVTLYKIDKESKKLYFKL